jgi:hypothetical protein
MSAAWDAPYAAVPAAYLGVWQRTLLEAPGRAPDTTSTVFWLQTAHWHGDLRLPAQRPAFFGCRGVADCTPAQRRWLASQQGFAGITEVSAVPGAGDDTTFCQWHRQVDFQPARPHRDFGRMVFSNGGATVDEYGVDADYRETWVRLPQSTGASGAWRSEPDTAGPFGELLLVAGTCFFFLRDRRAPLPAVDDLQAVANRSDGALLLDMELSFGHWNAAAGTGTILHSTLPWREGQELVREMAWLVVR